MSENLTKRAAEMLLNGATLLSEPCPYCSGVRVMKEGKALCINCGREPENKKIPEPEETKKSGMKEILEKKLEDLTKELEKETDHSKQQDILKSINSVMETLEKIKKQ